MSTYFKRDNSYEEILYSKILLLSRNKSFYTKLQLNDTFHNRINLIFFIGDPNYACKLSTA